MPNSFVRYQLEILAAKGMTIFRGEVRERHFIGATHFRIKMVDLTCETIWRQPFSHRVGIKKRSIDSLRRRPEHAMKANYVRSHDSFAFLIDVMTDFVRIYSMSIHLRRLTGKMAADAECAIYQH
ncbi:hypothetical protein SAMN04515620_101106 [Collimonas sp. OK607]|nr:hypothetical protein SAMN04515620_101106 [Collimonas sp. OK607]